MEPIVKPQTIRLLDVLVIGPLMVWGAFALRRVHPVGAAALGAFGLTTVGYNTMNWFRVRDIQAGG